MIRVMTWNLWWRFGPWQERSKAILATLRAERPDVVGLQAVWEQGGDNLAGRLAEELGMHWAWSPSPVPDRWQRRIGDSSVRIGNAVLSRWPITATAVERLPSGEEPPDGQTALFARIAAPGGDIPFFDVHLISYEHASATAVSRSGRWPGSSPVTAATGRSLRSSPATSTPTATPTRCGCWVASRRRPWCTARS